MAEVYRRELPSERASKSYQRTTESTPNHWLALSIEIANQRNYLDNLFRVYPTIPENVRDISDEIWKDVEQAFNNQDNLTLIENLLKLELFPIKDSYVAYLKRDKSAIKRNPNTVNRLCGRIYEMGLEETYKRATEPKETNRQIGPLFKNWLRKNSLGIKPVTLDEFVETKDDAVLDASDAEMKNYASKHLNYTLDKGLDLIARFNGKYVIGEAKFLTDFGGHQNAQFNDGVAPLNLTELKAIPVSILDGVLYIKSNNKMHTTLTTTYRDKNIMSSLVLREFLYQL